MCEVLTEGRAGTVKYAINKTDVLINNKCTYTSKYSPMVLCVPAFVQEHGLPV